MNRVRDWAVAPMAEKNTKRDAPGALGGAHQAHAWPAPLSSSSEPAGWSRIDAARWITVSHPAQGVAERARVGQVAQRQLHPHPVGPEPARVAHQAAHGLGPDVGQPPQHARGRRCPVAPVSRITRRRD